ncbi:hypothetical protein [Arthrobacter sp. H35-D1]|uniref:hypothetical protein n=1 Tax=Arthrobacter sp. H35-D1 TaxID=3046202 RepID=UPI0024B9325A|nr:hypothetical protein [Arthrobacter sp. H35-D1]MDJ0312538.1 hypothetical protein [Arthrobacter sp. H35-D1]
MEIIEPALDDAGFAHSTYEDSIQGAWAGITSINNLGGELRITAKSSTKIAVSTEASEEICTMNVVQ